MHQTHVTAASELLRIGLEERKEKAKLAKLVETRLDLVTRWTKGERKPTPPMRTRLKRELGIAWELWDQDPPTVLPSRAEVVAMFAAAKAAKEAGGEPAPTFPFACGSTGTDGAN